MRVIAERIYSSSNFEKALKWGKLISITGAAQLIVQAIGLISGLLIIRQLSTQEYALYTLTNTFLGSMLVLTNGGIVTGVMSQGSKVWQNKIELGAVVNTGLELRRKYSIICFIILSPVLLFLLRHHGSSWLMGLLLIASIIPVFFTTLSGALLEIPVKLKQDISSFQKIQVVSNIGRLLLVSLTLLLCPWAFIVILVGGLPQLWTNKRLRNTIIKYTDLHQSSSPVIKSEIVKVVKRILPGSIYYCLSAQIIIWVVSIFGSTASVAQVGALSRLAMILNLFGILFNTLLVPRFARLHSSSGIILTRFFQILLGAIFFYAIVVAISYYFPNEILWILGEKYGNLENEVIIYTLGVSISMIAGCAFSLYISKGHTINPVLSIPISLAAIFFSILIIDVSDLRGILIFNIVVASFELVMHVIFGLLQFRKYKTVV